MITELTATGKPFIHYHAAHCESGVTSAMFRDKGVDISEPMAFGIGSGIFFAHLPFLKSLGHSVSTFRSQPGAIFRKTAKRLGADFVTKTFRDPTFEYPVDCSADSLERARFARGPMEGSGVMYYPKSVNLHPDLREACIKGMKDSCNMMIRIPLPFFGVRGIRFLAKKVIQSEVKLGVDEARRNLGAVIRWLEEVGTGGSGFRYMYAAFLQEASELFGSEDLAELSRDMTAIGDTWRDFSVMSARIIKQRNRPEETFAKAGGLMLICAGREENFFKNLDKVVRKLKA